MDLALGGEKKQLQLQHDVLGYILSKLNLKEATIYSLVNKDWRCAWLYGITDLDFDASWKFPQYRKGEYVLVRNDDANWYVNWVNRVIESLRVQHINSFRVNFHLKKKWVDDIDRWLAFAFGRRVKNLEFDFSSCFLCHSDCYTFPDISDPIECLRIFPSHVNVYSSISNLQSLSLVFVALSPQTLEFILSNCPLLEQLCIGSCMELSYLRISGSSLTLKHLQIYECYIKGFIQIDAPNLSSFECDYSVFRDVIFSNTHQKLIQVTVPMDSTPFKNFSQYTPQLEELVLMVDFCLPNLLLSCSEGVELFRLKRIELVLEGYDYDYNYHGEINIVYIVVHIISYLLHGAPHIDTLKINFGPNIPPDLEIQNDDDYYYYDYYYDGNYYDDCYDDDDNYNEVEEEEEGNNVPTCHKHAFLKSVEIRCSIFKDKQISRMLELLAEKLEQILPSCTQLLFLD